MMHFLNIIAIASIIGLGGCSAATPTPDYTIRVVPAAKDQDAVAVPPTCVPWTENDTNFFDNQPHPQFGCADARNLALMVDRPDDLLRGRDPGPARGVLASGSIRRYDNNQTRGLIGLSQTPDMSVDTTSAPTASSSLSGESPAGSSASGK